MMSLPVMDSTSHLDSISPPPRTEWTGGMYHPGMLSCYLMFFTEFSDKNICLYLKGLEPATPCVRDQDATTLPARNVR